MLARGAERAAEEGLTNVAFAQADAQVEPFADGRFDLVVSRFGVMFFSDPVAAFANLARATRPGGRLGLVVWRPFAGNEWVEAPRAALAVGRDLPPIPEDVPGPFGLADPDRVRRILDDAGGRRSTSPTSACPTTTAWSPRPRRSTAARSACSGRSSRGWTTPARAIDALAATMTEHSTATGRIGSTPRSG